MSDGSFNPVVQPDVGQTMNNILGLQQKKQALQTGQYTQESAAAKADSDTRTNQQSSRIAAYMANPANRGKKADDMKDDLISIGGEQGQAAYEKQLALENKETDLKSAQSKLSTENQQRAGAIFSSFVGSNLPNAQLADRLQFAAKANPQLAETLGHYGDLLTSGQVPDTDGKTPNPARDQMANQVAVSLGAKSPLQGGLQDTGPGLAQATTNTNTGQVTGGPQVFQKGLAPTEQVGYKAASAGATANAGARATGAAGADMERSKAVADAAKPAANVIPLTQDADRLVEEVGSGKLTGWAVAKLKDAGWNGDPASAQAALHKIMGNIKTQAEASASSDSARATIDSSFPDENAPRKAFHAGMDQVRGLARQTLSQEQNRQAYAAKHPDMAGFQTSDTQHATGATPLQHEFNSLTTQKERNDFRLRHFDTQEQAQQFENDMKAAKHNGALQ